MRALYGLLKYHICMMTDDDDAGLAHVLGIKYKYEFGEEVWCWENHVAADYRCMGMT